MADTTETTPVPEWQLKITEAVRLLLTRHRRTNAELARAMGVAPSQLGRSMTTQGKHRREWSVPDLLKIADFFEVDAGDLLNGDLQRLLMEGQQLPGHPDQPPIAS